MPKLPPRDDKHKQHEQPEYPSTTYPVRRRRASVSRRPQAQRQQYHSDEHPEVPKIKRASLDLHQPETEVSAQPETDPLDDTENVTTDPVPSTRYKKPTTNKIIVTPPSHRPSSAYQPRRPQRPQHPPGSEEYSHRRPQPSLYTRLQSLSHNQPVLILGLVLIFLIIVIPLTVALTRPQQGNFLNGGNGQPNATPPPAGVQSALDPHELIITPQDTDHPAPPVIATSAYLLDADTGATLYAHNPFLHLPMLSTTKLMTAVIAVEHGNPDQKITITPAIDHDISQLSADSSLFGIKKGETYTLREMLYGLLLASGNDAAIAIADTISGNVPNFVALMNQKAQQIGLFDTHYMNPHGLLQTRHFSSAHDLAILGKYTMNIPLIHQITGTQQYHIPAGGKHPERYLLNGNQFLWWYPGVDGGKPGWDGASDFVQVVSVTRNHHHLIGVVMNTHDWWTDMRDLMNWGFDNFQWISPYDVDKQHPIPYDFSWDYFVKDKKENTIPTADGGRYYIYTGFSISGLVMAYFDKSGGLKKFGYPTNLAAVSATSIISQQFEHGTIQCNITTKQCNTT